MTYKQYPRLLIRWFSSQTQEDEEEDQEDDEDDDDDDDDGDGIDIDGSDAEILDLIDDNDAEDDVTGTYQTDVSWTTMQPNTLTTLPILLLIYQRMLPIVSIISARTLPLLV